LEKQQVGVLIAGGAGGFGGFGWAPATMKSIQEIKVSGGTVHTGFTKPPGVNALTIV